MENNNVITETRIRLDNNFKELSPTGEFLLPQNFSEISLYKWENYTNHFQVSWIEVLKIYNKLDELMSYLKIKYKEYYETTGNQGIKLFAKSIGTSEVLFKHLNVEELRNYIGVKKRRRTYEDLKNNYLYIVKLLGRPPLNNTEFIENTKIMLRTYQRSFKIKDNILDNIVRMFSNQEEYEYYLTLKEESLYKSRRSGKVGVYKFNDEYILNSTFTIVDNYIKENKMIPSYEEFESLSDFSLSIFKSRFDKTYLQILSELGFDLNEYDNKTEIKVLNNLSKILNEKYISQQSFNWLKSENNVRLRCDGHFKNLKLIVEYDGQQHFEPVEFWGGEENLRNVQLRDQIKNELIPQHGLTLLRIAYDEPYDDIEYLKFKLLEVGIVPPNHTLIHNKTKELQKAS